MMMMKQNMYAQMICIQKDYNILYKLSMSKQIKQRKKRYFIDLFLEQLTLILQAIIKLLFNDQGMFKNMEKRFEYDINPQNKKDYDRMSNKYNPNGRNYPENSVTATTPHQKRSFINTSLQEERERQNISIQESFFNGPLRNEEKYERGRISSASGLKRSVDKAPLGRSGKSQYAVDQNYRQTKKVYFGGDDSYNRDIEIINPRSEQGAKYVNKTEQMKKYRGGEDQRGRQEVDPFTLQENVNYSNTRIDMSKEKSKKHESKNEPDFQVNEKQIVQKINRINRLNEQINNRLQRMLNKIDNS